MDEKFKIGDKIKHYVQRCEWVEGTVNYVSKDETEIGYIVAGSTDDDGEYWAYTNEVESV